MKVGSLIHHLTKIIAAIKANGPVVVIPSAGIADSKPAEWFRSHSALNIPAHERTKQRNRILNAEVVDGKEKLAEEGDQASGGLNGESSESGSDQGRQDQNGVAPQQGEGL